MANTATTHRPINEYPEIMRVGDIKAYLGIVTNAAYDLTHHPKFPTMRIGNSIRIRRDKLLQFLEKLEGGAA